MKKTVLILLIACISFTGCSQNRVEKIKVEEFSSSEPPEYSCGVFDETNNILSHKVKLAHDTAAGTRVIIKGIVYLSDGITPAANTLMYFYQTDNAGRYSKHNNEDRKSYAWWHGYMRGFLKTNDKGEYEINTIKPAPYPARIEPAHIHCTVKSPKQKRCYNIADFVFADDELLTADYWQATNRLWKSLGIDDNAYYGGIILHKFSGDVWIGKRDIVLLNEYDLPNIESGNPIGSESPAFSPEHVAGPDKGSHACPMCKYGYHPGIMLFVNTDNDWDNVKAICKRLEEESIKRKSEKFKAYLIYTNPNKLSIQQLQKKLQNFAVSLPVNNLAITYVPAINDTETEMHLNNINPATKNTIIVYNRRMVFDKFIDFTPTVTNFNLLFNSIDEAGNWKGKLDPDKHKPVKQILPQKI